MDRAFWIVGYSSDSYRAGPIQDIRKAGGAFHVFYMLEARSDDVRAALDIPFLHSGGKRERE